MISIFFGQGMISSYDFSCQQRYASSNVHMVVFFTGPFRTFTNFQGQIRIIVFRRVSNLFICNLVFFRIVTWY